MGDGTDTATAAAQADYNRRRAVAVPDAAIATAQARQRLNHEGARRIEDQEKNDRGPRIGRTSRNGMRNQGGQIKATGKATRKKAKT